VEKKRDRAEMEATGNVIPASPETAAGVSSARLPLPQERPRKMNSLRAAVTILFAAAAFILPAVGTAVASQTAAAPLAAAASTPDDTPWH
jgi:hypothetical protein